MYPSIQLHIGVWFITLHRALVPQEPGHGSLHFCVMHARLLGHSGLTVHSGRQFGGLPMYLGKQEHEGLPPISLHSLFGPQGDGTQGFCGTGCSSGGGGGMG